MGQGKAVPTRVMMAASLVPLVTSAKLSLARSGGGKVGSGASSMVGQTDPMGRLS